MLNILKSRRSTRRFLPEMVPETLLRSVIEIAILAPSAHNRQPWRFVVLQSKRAKQILIDHMSVAMAGAHLLLAAHASGLAGVWMCAPLFAQASVRRAFDLPETWEPQGLILLGYSDQTPLPPQRKPVGEVSVFI